MTLFLKMTRQFNEREQAILATLSDRFPEIADVDFAKCLIEARFLLYLADGPEQDLIGVHFLKDEFPELQDRFAAIERMAPR